jgi:alpha-ketoglutarate-dependent taurine dioxygenase
MNTVTLASSTLTKVDLTPRIGTEIKTDVDTLLSGRHAAEIRETLEQRGVLIFRGLHLTKPQQKEFGATLGKVQGMGGDGIMPITLDKKINAFVADYLKGSFYWHIDGASEDVPNFAALLNAHVLSPTGGQTLFTNTYAAWDDLPDDEKAQIEHLRVVHSMETSQRLFVPQPTYEELLRWQERKPKVHPLVWTHQSGRKSLILGATASHIEGMSLEAGRLLLCKLQEWATQPQFVYRHEWQVGDLLIWDNTGTMHRVEPYEEDSGRLMSRTTLEGEEAVG